MLSVPLPTPDILSRVYGNVFARGGQVEHTPLSDDGFDEIVSKHAPLVYKPHALEQFSHLLGCPYPIVLRRPDGFGLDTFVSMLSAWLDLDYDANNDPFEMLMRPVAPPVGFHSSYILELDFARIRGTDDVSAKLSKYITQQTRLLLERYDISDKIRWRDSERTPNLPPSEYIGLLAVGLSVLSPSLRGPLFVIIRNFDTLSCGYTDGADILNSFLHEMEEDVRQRTVHGLLLVSTWNDGTIEHCVGRAPGSALTAYPAFNRLKLGSTLDISHLPALQTAAGFTENEIEDLDRTLGAASARGSGLPPVMERIKAGYCLGAAFSDDGWFGAQRTWSGYRRRSASGEDDPARWLRTLNNDDADVAVYSARDVMELLRGKYGFPLTCTPRFEF